MRRLRITVVLAAVACVVGAFASPALAKKEKPKAFFGEFVSSVPTGGPITPSTPAIAKSKEGFMEPLLVGSKEHPLFKIQCETLTSAGKVFEEHSKTFKTEIKFHKCKAGRRLAGGFIEGEPEKPYGSKCPTSEAPKRLCYLKAKIGPGLEMEFHANGGVTVGEEENNEAKITKGTSIGISVKGGLCHLVIPEQSVPKNSETEVKEVEGASYSGEREPEANLKKYPNGFKERTEITWELSKLLIEIPVEKSGACQYEKEPGGKFNEETNSVVEPSTFEGELDEVEIKNGEFFFETATEHKEKEI
jgi:hypothetical protein